MFLFWQIGEDHGNCGVIACFFDLRLVKGNQQLALFDRLAVRDVGSEMFALEVYGVYPDMDEQFCAVTAGKTDGKVGIKYAGYRAVCWGKYFSLRWDDCNPVP